MKTIKAFRKSIPKTNFMICLFFIVVFAGCNKNDGPEEETKLSNAKQITSFVFLLTNNPIEVNVVATIDDTNKTITAEMPPDTDLTGLLPEVKLSALATIDLTAAQNFEEALEYTVTAEDGSATVYTVTITTLLTQRQILQAILDANPGNSLGWDLQNTADLDALSGVTTNTEGQIIALRMDGNLISIPIEIGQLTNLEDLNLAENQLTSIPKEIGQLTNLKLLHLGDNQLTVIPPEIGQLTKLTSLFLSNNKLSTIPSEIEQLTNLERLAISFNQFTSVPLEVVKLTNLTELFLSGNQITSLPPELGQLTNLTSLLLSINQLTSLPPELGRLTNLINLGFSYNQLSSLPPEIGKLTNLKFLIFGDNQLTSIPPEIGFLTKLEILSMTDNILNSIPESVLNLKLFNNTNVSITYDTDTPFETASQKDALISIYSANPGNTLDWGVDSFPEVTFHENGDPKAITMNNKNLTRIPENINRINSLETLNANNNNLESLPSSLGSIETLAVLTLASNQLNTVPPELGQLNNLALLSITNNPLTNLPQEVCDQRISNGGILTLLTDPGEGCN